MLGISCRDPSHALRPAAPKAKLKPKVGPAKPKPPAVPTAPKKQNGPCAKANYAPETDSEVGFKKGEVKKKR